MAGERQVPTSKIYKSIESRYCVKLSVHHACEIIFWGNPSPFPMAEVMLPRGLFGKILSAIAALRPLPPARC
jgi:hypothetical protein